MKYSYLLLLYILCACSSEHEEVQPSARRTLLVYLAGDNNLSGEVDDKTDSILSGWHNTQDYLLIYRDAHNQTPSLLQAVGHPTHPFTKLIKEYPESNSADPAVFSEVLRDVRLLYPSPSFGLLVFSHGTGWLPEGMFTQPRSKEIASGGLRSIMNDNGREMAIADFAVAIPDHTFDFIVFEACLMSGVEVAYELRNKANYMVASSAEILSPGFTPIYPELIESLFEQPSANLQGVAKRYYEHCNNLSGPYRSGTISLLNLQEVEGLAEATRKVLSSTNTKYPDISTFQCFDRGGNKLFFDFGDYMEQASPLLYPKIEEALSKVVLYQATTPMFVNVPIRRHSGLTVYVEQGRYPELDRWYGETAWYRAVFSMGTDYQLQTTGYQLQATKDDTPPAPSQEGKGYQLVAI